MQSAKLAARRYLRLVEQIGDELQRKRGWKTRASERLGVSDAFIGQVLTGEKDAGGDAIALAIERIKIDPRFFFDEKLGEEPDYAQHLRWKSEPAEKMPAAWDEFMRTIAPSLRLTPEETAWLRAIRTHRATATSYLQALIIRRDGLSPEDAEASAEATADAAKRGAVLGVQPRRR